MNKQGKPRTAAPEVPCRVCKGRYSVFYESRRIPDRSGYGEIIIGLFSCPLCGAEEIGYRRTQ